MATTRWKDKTLITALADDDNFPVTDTDDTNTDKRATAAKIGSYVASATLTLSGKTIDLDANTLTGTASEFDAALQSDTFVFNSEIGSVVQAWDADLDTLAGLSSADGNFIVGSAGGWVVESGATVRTSLGLGSLATQSTINDSDWSGTDLAVANGGTGASTASGARTNLGLEIGEDVAAHTPSINAQTGTAYTGVLTDEGKVVTMDNASANTFTIPANSSVAYPSGTIINVIQKGAGTTTIAGDTGVTVNGTSGGSVDVGNQYQGGTCLKIATDTWIVSGDVS